MHIHVPMTGLIGVTELDTFTFHFCAKLASISLVGFSVDIVVSKKFRLNSRKSSFSLFVPSFIFINI